VWALLKQNLRHIVRTKLLLVLLLFSFFIQYVGLKALHYATFHFQGVMTTVQGDFALFIALFFSLFTGAYISAAYGIWMVPYLHQGGRSSLTFTLPVSRWKFPLAYALTMLLLLLLQHAVMLLSYGLNFGFDQFSAVGFQWAGLAKSLLVETIVFEVFMFAFAIGSVIFGQLPTFFLGAGAIFLLQIGGAIFRISSSVGLPAAPHDNYQLARLIYSYLPPVGELFFDMRLAFYQPAKVPNLWLWIAWLGILMVWFRLKLQYPLRSKASES
jgi:hypothetical protein